MPHRLERDLVHQQHSTCLTLTDHHYPACDWPSNIGGLTIINQKSTIGSPWLIIINQHGPLPTIIHPPFIILSQSWMNVWHGYWPLFTMRRIMNITISNHSSLLTVGLYSLSLSVIDHASAIISPISTMYWLLLIMINYSHPNLFVSWSLHSDRNNFECSLKTLISCRKEETHHMLWEYPNGSRLRKPHPKSRQYSPLIGSFFFGIH